MESRRDPDREQQDRQGDELVAWLGAPQAYGHRPESVEHLQTHISHVFLAGKYVYKLKKPVKFDFLDFSTLADRERACREEFRLNRRLARDVYLRVVPVVRTAEGKFELAAHDAPIDPARVVDWLVEMRRLPTELMLDALHQRGELRPEHIARLADTLVRFYESLEPLRLSPEEYRDRYVQHVAANLHELLEATDHLSRRAVRRVHGQQLQLLRLRPELFDQRVDAGRIVDGHGDLRPEHICLSEPIAIFDCIEFNAEFRRIDVADELAFLAEECDCLGARWVGTQLLAAYQAASGDRPPEILWDFYKSYRACVRAKVAVLRAAQLEGDLRQLAAGEARKHLSLAEEYIERWLRPLVLVIGGLSGTGKTTLAKGLADALGAELLRTDIIRKELFGAGPHAADAGGGIYQPEARRRVYVEMTQRLKSLHGDDVSVVLDGTFSTVDTLRAVEATLIRPQGVFLAIECVCRKEVARKRIGVRLADGTDASDARPEIHDIQRMQWEAWPEDIPQVRVDTEQPLEQQVGQVLCALMTRYRLEHQPTSCEDAGSAEGEGS